MEFKKPKIISVTLVALWTLCLLHSFAEGASAHWHFQESRDAHHHHHPLNGAHQHEDGEPAEHSHNPGPAECCEFKAQLSSSASASRDPLGQSRTVEKASLISSIYSTPFPTHVSRVEPRAAQESIFTDLSRHILTLRAPNAPPSIAVI